MNYNTWMADCTEIHPKLLKQICLPASHDSGTYDLSDTLTKDPSPELAKILNKLSSLAADIENIPLIAPLIPNPFEWITSKAIPAIRGLSTATSRRVLDQLNDGIRCLDLRVYCDTEDQQFYISHGLKGSPLTDVLNDIQSFLAATNGEIVYVTIGHWINFSSDFQYAEVSALVKERLGGYAYIRQGSTTAYRNNPFEQTFSQIVTQSGNVQSTVILVNGKSDDSIFWPSAFSPPDNSGSSGVLTGYYTDTTDVTTMIKTQLTQFQTAQSGTLPFALYMTLTPQPDDVYKVVMASLASAIAGFAAPLFWYVWSAPIALALLAIAAGLKIYGEFLPWTTLRELSLDIDGQLQTQLVPQFQSLNPAANQVSFIYVDTYEETNVVDIAIQYSGGTITSAPRMTQIFAAMNLYNNNLELFGIGTDNSLYHNFYDNQWHTWTPDFSGATFEAASVFGSVNFVAVNMEVFSIDESGILWHNWYSSAQQGWQTTWDTAFDQSPAPSSFASLFVTTNFQNLNIELFAVDTGGALWHNSYSNNQWNGWTADFGPASSGIASVFGEWNVHSDLFEVFVIDEGGTLWERNRDSSGWQNSWIEFFDDASANLSSVFAITNAYNQNFELFAVDTSGNLWHNLYDATNWSGWSSGFYGAPANAASFFAVNNSNGNLEIFVIDDGGVLWHNWFAGGAWQNSWQLDFNNAPLLNSVFGLVNSRSGSLELYGIGDNNVLWHCWYDNSNSTWQLWSC